MTASARKIDKAMKYLQDAVTAMKRDVHSGDLTFIAEWQLYLAKVKIGKLSPSEATAESRESFSIDNTLRFRRDKETFAAAVGKVYVLTQIGDVDSKAKARRIIDESLAPFLISVGHDYVFKALLYLKTHLCTIEVANGEDDLAKALRNLAKHEYRNIDQMIFLTGRNPSSWRAQIDDLRKEKSGLSSRS